VVNAVQRLVKPEKVGHAGTLDPLATGVLVVCVGKATRLIELVQRQAKHYRGEFLLGRSSETDDIDGDVRPFAACSHPTLQQLSELLPSFIGHIEQTPPAYSAVKIGGRRAYDLARKGAQLSLAPRTVLVHDMQILSYEYPRLALNIHCGSGVYVRALGRDLALAGGSRAVMSSLVRTAVGPFRIEDAATVSQLQSDGVARWLLPAATATQDLQQVQLQSHEVEALRFATMLPDRWQLDQEELAAIDPNGQLVAVLKRKGDQYRPWRNFVGGP
jgi:tRNA pseudouridine55 synthase